MATNAATVSSRKRSNPVVLCNYCIILLNPLLQISSKQLHQPRNSLKFLHNNGINQNTCKTIASARRFPKISLQQLHQLEYLRYVKGETQEVAITALSTKSCTSTQRYPRRVLFSRILISLFSLTGPTYPRK